MKVSESGEYAFEAKNAWRKKIWNEIGRRVVNNRGATVLYLPGPDDLDRRQAMRKAFRSSNLIGVDTDKKLVADMKADGKIAIQGKMSDVLLSWPVSRPVDVVVADTCNVFGQEVRRILAAAFGGRMSQGGVMVINIQRGRESGANLVQVEKTKRWFRDQIGSCTMSHATGEMNRGWAVMMMALKMALNPDGKRAILKPAYERKLAQMKVKVGSYKSGVRMDSCIFSVFPECEVTDCGTDKLKRKITATLAVQTMRQNGKLPKSPRA